MADEKTHRAERATDKVDDLEIQTAITNRLRLWKRTGSALERTYEFPDFETAIDFVEGVAEEAEKAQHHPDIDIRYNKVTLRLTSHDAGGITRRDLTLAGHIQEIAPKYQKAA